MKKMILSFVFVMSFSALTYAQPPEPLKPGTPQQVSKPMMQDSTMTCCGMNMKKMMGQRMMMMEDMLNLMKEIISVQERLAKGVKPKESKALLNELSIMRAKIEKMIAEMKGMMKAMHDQPQAASPEDKGLPKAQSKDTPAQQPAHQH